MFLFSWDSGSVGTIAVYDGSDEDGSLEDARAFKVILGDAEDWYRKIDLIRSEVAVVATTSAEEAAFTDFFRVQAELDTTDTAAIMKCLKTEFKATNLKSLKKLDEEDMAKGILIAGLKKVPANDLIDAWRALKSSGLALSPISTPKSPTTVTSLFVLFFAA